MNENLSVKAEEFIEAIDRLHGTRILIAIAYRVSAIKKYDVIYKVGNGKSAEREKIRGFSYKWLRKQ